MKYRVLVVEDHDWWRRYISSALAQASQWEVVGVVADGIEAVEKARDLKPDVILLDVGLPSLDGIQAARRILAHDPSSSPWTSPTSPWPRVRAVTSSNRTLNVNCCLR